MKKIPLLLLIIAQIFFFHPVYSQQIPVQKKQKIIILTSMNKEQGDQQSLIRLLLYSNVLDIKGICITDNGNSENGLQTVYKTIEAYNKVKSNLDKHASGFPEAANLKEAVKKGSKNSKAIGKGYDSEASDWIIKTVDNATQPVWICIWDGQRELAQALYKIKETRTAAQVDSLISRIRVHAIGDPDGYKNWIMENFPDIFYISDGFLNTKNRTIEKYSCYFGQYLTGNFSEMHSVWVYENITTGHGPLGALYPNDTDDIKGMKELATPTFDGLIPNGLNFPNFPEWGGYGGRFRNWKNAVYTDAQDYYFGSWNERHTVSRWRTFFQRDFQSRLNWCIKSYRNANHNPVAIVDGDSTENYIEQSVEGGEFYTFDASASFDPDSNRLQFNWYLYNEPSDFSGCVSLDGYDRSKVSIFIPPISLGKTLHLILEVTDNGDPYLTSFRRILLHVDKIKMPEKKLIKKPVIPNIDLKNTN